MIAFDLAISVGVVFAFFYKHYEWAALLAFVQLAIYLREINSNLVEILNEIKNKK
jgi:hypothetical protein